MYLVSIFIFGLIGYSIGRKQKRGPSYRAEIILAAGLVLSFFVRGVFLGFGPVRIFVSAILAGVLGGILVGRLRREPRNDLPERAERV